jgi:hypothetical protein
MDAPHGQLLNLTQSVLDVAANPNELALVLGQAPSSSHLALIEGAQEIRPLSAPQVFEVLKAVVAITKVPGLVAGPDKDLLLNHPQTLAASQRPSIEFSPHQSVIEGARLPMQIESQFEAQIRQIQQRLQLAFAQYRERVGSDDKAEAILSTLDNAQGQLFEGLKATSTREEIQQLFSDFTGAVKDYVSDVDRVMGHGYLYKAAEVTLKAVVGLFAALGMAVGGLITAVTAGFVKAGVGNEGHRQAFAGTFFSMNKTDSQQAARAFKDEIIGKDENPGIVSEESLAAASA